MIRKCVLMLALVVFVVPIVIGIVAPVSVFAQAVSPVAPAATPAVSVAGAVWAFLNSTLGIGILAGGLLWVLNLVYAKKPLWQSFEGIIINAVKMAEKAIPDDTQSASAAKMDHALKLVVAIYEEYAKRKATDAEVLSLKNGISIVHDKLDAAGTLGGGDTSTTTQ
jgi:hypothetical protein